MNRCPLCNEWSLDYDSYFGRYRCYNPDCEWMAPSSAVREMRMRKTNIPPRIIFKQDLPNSDLKFVASYDEVNDALIFDFGIREPAYDLPEPDGRVIWKISHLSEMVSGIILVGAKKFGVSHVSISINMKQEIEEILKKIPNPFSAGRPSKTLIEKVELVVKTEKEPRRDDLFKEAMNKFEESVLNIH